MLTTERRPNDGVIGGAGIALVHEINCTINGWQNGL